MFMSDLVPQPRNTQKAPMSKSKALILLWDFFLQSWIKESDIQKYLLKH